MRPGERDPAETSAMADTGADPVNASSPLTPALLPDLFSPSIPVPFAAAEDRPADSVQPVHAERACNWLLQPVWSAWMQIIIRERDGATALIFQRTLYAYRNSPCRT